MRDRAMGHLEEEIREGKKGEMPISNASFDIQDFRGCMSSQPPGVRLSTSSLFTSQRRGVSWAIHRQTELHRATAIRFLSRRSQTRAGRNARRAHARVHPCSGNRLRIGDTVETPVDFWAGHAFFRFHMLPNDRAWTWANSWQSDSGHPWAAWGTVQLEWRRCAVESKSERAPSK